MTRFPSTFTPAEEAASVRSELREAFERVTSSGRFLLGPELEALESELSARAGRSYVVGVASGTDALVLTLKALGVGPGDDVVVPAYTAVPTAAAVVLAGARPVLADVDPKTACLTSESVEAAITPRTSCVIAVHLHGFPADLSAVEESCNRQGIALLEDMAQAFGATLDSGEMVGGKGVAAAASFYPTKVLSALGDAGAVMTDDVELASRVRLLRSHGHVGDYIHEVVAGNSRLDEIQAAFLRVKLSHIDEWIPERREVAMRFRERLSPYGFTFQPAHPGHVYQTLAARHAERDRILEEARRRGGELMVHYPRTIGAQPAFAELGYTPGTFPNAEAWVAEELSLPTTPQTSSASVDALAEVLVSTAKRDPSRS